MIDEKVLEMRRDHRFLAKAGYYCSYCDFRDQCADAKIGRRRRA